MTEQLTVRRSGRYPRFASEAATPSARRGPDRLRIVKVVRPARTACGDALDLQVVIWIPEEESLISMVYVEKGYSISLFPRNDETRLPWNLQDPRT